MTTEGEALAKAARKAIKRRKPNDRMPEEVDRWSRWRAAQFAHATQGKGEWGKPIGHGKPPK